MTPIGRYSSSIGTAAGADLQESTLHGICELVEHDVLSHALLRWFIAGDPRVSVLDIASLPDDARLLHGIAVEVTGADVILLDVTTDIGIPAYLAVNAVLRALGELIQVEPRYPLLHLRTCTARVAHLRDLDHRARPRTLQPGTVRPASRPDRPRMESVDDHYSVNQLVTTSTPSSVRQRSRNGPSGTG
jgi:ribosomal protein S12 methylthiotransferase accessory factor YcaO